MTLERGFLLLSSGTLLVSGSAAFAYFVVASENNPLQRLYQAYVARLDTHLGFLLTSLRGSQLARGQLIAGGASCAVFLPTRSPAFVLLSLLIASVPPFILWKKHVARVSRLERQLDTWLLMLANALKSTSSVGEAIASTETLVPKPFSEEIDLLVKELQLGAPLDRAIHAVARRIGSTVISGALATIVVARQTGGDLPQTLERASAVLRESARLEGVLRTKTADGRGQVLVLASVPFVLCLMIAWLNPSWFDPMLNQHVGRVILVACVLAWTVATFWAAQIAKGDS